MTPRGGTMALPTGRILLVVVGLAVASIYNSRCSAFGFVPWGSSNAKRYPTFVWLANKQQSGGGIIRDESDPDNWDCYTNPLVAVMHFADTKSKEGNGTPAGKIVTEKKIKAVLRKNSITTLDMLLKKFLYVAVLLKADATGDFCLAVAAACQRARVTAEEVLGGEIIYDDYCIRKESIETYAEGAVSVSATAILPLKEGVRKQPFNLVLGSSGSGKTLFALKRLPKMAFGGEGKNVFTVHFQADYAYALMSDTQSFPESVASHVRKLIEDKITEKGWGGVKALNLHLHVVIDEAGNDSFSEYINMAVKVRQIVASIKKAVRCKFERGVHLTLVGTGLDRITSEIKSVVDANKFRMQPWTLENFDAFVASSDHDNKVMVTAIVRDFPILKDLVTNARCAFHLLDAMNTVSFLRKNRLKKFVSVLVSAVADRYVQSNGLRMLQSTESKWIVARSVFRELDNATRKPGVPFFPEYQDISSDLRGIASSILEVHVESKGNKLNFANSTDRYAVSMSPALVIVMANLLNSEAEISWDWQGFESTVMLSELKRMVVKSETIPKRFDRLVIQLQSPAPGSNLSFSFPLVDNATVILNGDKASYADVIAPYRLVQAKFSKDDSKSATLNLTNELDKMGLTNSSNHLIQRYLTQTLYAMWSVPRGFPLVEKSKAVHSVNKYNRLECYPMNILNSAQNFETTAMVSGRLSHDRKFTLEGDGIKESDLQKEFEENRPVTAVFATNCKAFQLKNTDIFIDHNDVDWTGKVLEKELPKDMFLLENVDVRFLFF